MRMKNFKIGTQLKIVFSVMLFFVVILSSISYIQSGKIHLQSETMYKHPLMVRRAIDMLRSDILGIRINLHKLFLISDEEEIRFELNEIETAKADAFARIDIIYNQYLGPRSDVDSLMQAFVIWNSICDENIRIFREGKTGEAAKHLNRLNNVGRQSIILLDKLHKIDVFAIAKGDDLYFNSIDLTRKLNIQLIGLTGIILLISVVIFSFLLSSIRKPLDEMTQAMKRFHNGDLLARSSYKAKSEFGMLSDTFNNLADIIQTNNELDQKYVSLAGMMLSKNEQKEFFRETISALSAHTGSQMAAVYILSKDKVYFDHYESLGVDENARKSFSARNMEGEFGHVLSSKKIQHIKNISSDTPFNFNTVSGTFSPREILTLPIIINREVVAIISLASINPYSQNSVQLLEDIFITLCARVEGILGYQKMREFSEKLELQNRELEVQKNELSAQSSELLEQNTELEIQKNQLSSANLLKTHFLSNMSHELRTPLNSVIALSGVLNRRLNKQIPEEEYSYIDVIERNAKHLLNLINDILDIARIESGREEIDITCFNAKNLVAEVVGMIMPQAEQKNISLSQTESETDLYITSDATKCRHILQNLIGNAVKFTEKGSVKVGVALTDNNVIITVTDTGIGISEEHISHIFDEFRQADNSTSRRFGGTGLGLAIAKKYAGLLGGSIDVRSSPGKGSEFTLILPLNYTNGSSLEPEETFLKHVHVGQPLQIDAAGSTLKTILLVEDSEPAIIQVKDFLEEGGYKILVAHNGAEALKIITTFIPDAIILDLMMPDIDGFELLKTLREAEPTALVPVLILTAKHITKEELRFIKRNNIHQLIQKGDVNRNELLHSVATMVNPINEKSKAKDTRSRIKQGKPVVLVVEDNPDNMVTVKALLANEFTVIEATDGEMSIIMALEYCPDLILMDIGLPGMDGIQAFKSIRKDGNLQHTPIIALTASALTSDREAILAYGFDAYISKPIDVNIFLKVINETLNGK